MQCKLIGSSLKKCLQENKDSKEVKPEWLHQGRDEVLEVICWINPAEGTRVFVVLEFSSLQ